MHRQIERPRHRAEGDGGLQRGDTPGQPRNAKAAPAERGRHVAGDGCYRSAPASSQRGRCGPARISAPAWKGRVPRRCPATVLNSRGESRRQRVARRQSGPIARRVSSREQGTSRPSPRTASASVATAQFAGLRSKPRRRGPMAGAQRRDRRPDGRSAAAASHPHPPRPKPRQAPRTRRADRRAGIERVGDWDRRTQASRKSVVPDQSVATTGRPSSIASAGTRPNPSLRWRLSTISAGSV